MDKNKRLLNIIILAAGEGKRLKTIHPKPLVPILGQPMIEFIIDQVILFLKNIKSNEDIVCQLGIVVGHQKDKVIEELTPLLKEKVKFNFFFPIQEEQLGTADAVKKFFLEEKKFSSQIGTFTKSHTLILCGDTPLLKESDFQNLFQSLEETPTIKGIVASFKIDNPHGYGRIVRGKIPQNRDVGPVLVEEREANAEEKEIKEVNAGVYFFETSKLTSGLEQIDNHNLSGEYYLTDLFKNPDPTLKALCFSNHHHFLGVNTLEQLEEVEHQLQSEINQNLQSEGVRLLNPNTIRIDSKVKIGKNTVIYPGTIIEGKTTIGEKVTIESGSIIKNSVIKNDVTILAYSYIDQSFVDSHVSIGPFARLRPETHLEQEVKIGNFVEVKKSMIHKGVKISHLSYVGDAEIGEESNIGCGFITCNYDGKKKHKTTIGKNTFIGSDCQAIAPVTLGDNVFVAAGSTITDSVSEGSFIIARSKQVTKEKLASKFLPKPKSKES